MFDSRKHARLASLSSAATLAVAALSLTACEVPATVEVDNTGTVVNMIPENLVCDPFGLNANYAGRQNGLKADLFYIPSGGTQYKSVSGYLENGTQLDASLYFNQINVPTRPFDRAFKTTGGRTLMNDVGQPVYEWFGLEMKGELRLSNNDRPGLYQFALLSDDGSILELKQDPLTGEYATIVNNDGTHPTRMGCATKAVRMDYNSRIPFRVKYYQGPRYHIALMLLWREIPDTADPAEYQASLLDSACGVSGNSAFFDSTQDPPVPTSRYLGMLDRGWKVLGPGNFLVPDDGVNPCEEVCQDGNCESIPPGGPIGGPIGV